MNTKIKSTEQCFAKLATDIMGTKLKTPAGEEVGVVQNLMIDPQYGTIIFIVLCYANFFGKMHRFFSISNEMLTVRKGNNSSMFLEIDKQRLINARRKSERNEDQYIYEILPEESKNTKGKQKLYAVS